MVLLSPGIDGWCLWSRVWHTHRVRIHGRFGLYAVDFDDPERPRTRRRSAEVFARIARANAITDEARAAVGE